MSLKSLSTDQGQRTVRSSPCCILSFCHFWWVVVSDHWSNNNSSRDLRSGYRMKELLVYHRETTLSRINPVRWPRRWLIPPSLDFWRLTICILAPESTTNSRSSGFLADGAGRHHSVVSEKKVSLVLFFELIDIFGKSPRVSAGASLLSFTLLKFHSVRTALMKNLNLIFPSDGPLISQILHDAA